MMMIMKRTVYMRPSSVWFCWHYNYIIVRLFW